MKHNKPTYRVSTTLTTGDFCLIPTIFLKFKKQGKISSNSISFVFMFWSFSVKVFRFDVRNMKSVATLLRKLKGIYGLGCNISQYASIEELTSIHTDVIVDGWKWMVTNNGNQQIGSRHSFGECLQANVLDVYQDEQGNYVVYIPQ